MKKTLGVLGLSLLFAAAIASQALGQKFGELSADDDFLAPLVEKLDALEIDVIGTSTAWSPGESMRPGFATLTRLRPIPIWWHRERPPSSAPPWTRTHTWH
jgi:hypothetical protein